VLKRIEQIPLAVRQLFTRLRRRHEFRFP
jgi:hypothetical protein